MFFLFGLLWQKNCPEMLLFIKGLVDAMSAFGVKNLIRRAVWVGDFSYKKAVDI